MTTHRYTTRVIVRADSHVSGEHDLSGDVVRMHTSKQTKGRGRFQFDLVPRKNYLNLLYPNDVINIYIDPGDGESGFIRTMLGYVDRVNRSETTDQSTGAVTTVFTVIGSDFQKAVEQTNIYFNPYVQTFIDKRFKNTLIGDGSTLRTNGIVAFGSPADFVENILLVLAGFGQQWVLPPTYKGGAARNNRLLRYQRSLRRLPQKLVGNDDFKSLLKGTETINDFVRNINLWVSTAKAVLAIDKKKKEKPADDRTARLFDAQEKSKVASRILNQELAFRVFGGALSYAESDLPLGIVDILEFGFIEHMAIDGFSANTTVWQSQGSLAQVLYGRSNPIVNELMFDLRPVSAGDRLISDGDYSRKPDELGINTDGYGIFGGKQDVEAVQYVPSVVMREYPFSTVDGFDLSNYYLFPPKENQTTGVGFMQFGPIFSKPAASSRRVERVLFRYAEPIVAEACLFSDEEPTGAIKHLDVCKIDDSDIVSMSVGRDDNDVINLFALYSSSLNTEVWKYLLHDISPIINPVSIARNGLRVQEAKTEYGNYSRDPECSDRGSAVDNEQIRRNLVRWQLLLDHWYQHNVEYLSGTVELRGMPWIRTGYRADFRDRNESYYIENVAHRWEYGKELRTSLSLSRGQRNDPFPAYIPPATPDRNLNRFPAISGGSLSDGQVAAFSSFAKTPYSVSVIDGGDRSEEGRLGKFFRVKDTDGTLYAVGGSPVEDDGNSIDKNPAANGAGRAEYAGEASSAPNDGRFGNVPELEDPAKQKALEEKKKKEQKKKKSRRRKKKQVKTVKSGLEKVLEQFKKLESS